MNGCPCGRGRAFDACCGPIIDGSKPAVTAEDLMRSRYSAFARGDEDHLQRSWHPDHLPRVINIDPEQTWLGLTIVATEKGGMLDQTGEVTFVARYEVSGTPGEFQENSLFERHQGRWVYTAGAHE